MAFTDAIRERRPRLAVVDDSRWNTPTPPTVPSIAACSSAFAFLWDQEIVEHLPSIARADGKFDGPQAGLVLGVWRSRSSEELLLSGRLAASTNVSDKRIAAAMDMFAADAWKAMRAVTSPVMAVDPSDGAVVREKVPEYRAGHHAIDWARASVSHFFRDRSVQAFFRPLDRQPTRPKGVP